MEKTSLGIMEYHLLSLIWENEPLTSSELAKKSETLLGWKKTTSFTVLKRLCNKGIFQNNGGTVTSLYSRKEYYSMQSEKFVEEIFSGSLPAFVAAFTSRKKLSADEIRELHEMIDNYEEGQ